MESKTIVFVGGVKDGIDRFEKFLKSKFYVKNVNVKTSFGRMLPEKFELTNFDVSAFNKLEEVIIQSEDFSYETLSTGETIRDFLSGKAEVLVLHDSSLSTRKYLCKVETLNIHRIFFGYMNDLPDGFDFNVNPNSGDFEEVIGRILNDEERISM